MKGICKIILHTTSSNRRIMLLGTIFVCFSLVISCNCELSEESIVQDVDLKNITKASNVHVLWEQFKRTYNKDYASDDEATKRFEIFAENVKKITDHNEGYDKGESTYRQGLNAFADYTGEEFRKLRVGGLG